MSVFGGTAVFCVLGFMAKQLGQPIDRVVQSGTGLAFVAYPEAFLSELAPCPNAFAASGNESDAFVFALVLPFFRHAFHSRHQLSIWCLILQTFRPPLTVRVPPPTL